MFGRNGESPVPIVAPQSPATASTPPSRRPGSRSPTARPVMLLSDGMLANGSEPWRIPASTSCPRSTRSSRPPPTTPLGEGERRRRPSSGPTCATRRRWPGPWAIPGTAGPRAPHRRPREGRRARQHLLRPGQPRLHGPHPPGQGRPDRRQPAPAGGRRPQRQRAGCQGAGARLGVDVRPDRRRRTPGPQGRLPRRPGAPAPPQPVPEGPRRRSSPATTRCSSPR